jgi:hypothetical protein
MASPFFLFKWRNPIAHINMCWLYHPTACLRVVVFFPYSDVRTLFHLRQLNYKAAGYFLLFHAAYAKLSIASSVA